MDVLVSIDTPAEFAVVVGWALTVAGLVWKEHLAWLGMGILTGGLIGVL